MRTNFCGAASSLARFVACALLVATACARSAPPASLAGVAATVHRFPIDSESWVLVPDGQPDVRWVPDSLPEPFRVDGLRVRIDAEPTDPPPNVRLVGPPIRLLRVERAEGRSPS